MTFLAIDVGNTRLKWACYASPRPGAVLLAHGAVFLEAIDALAETDWKPLAPPASMLGCIVAGEGVKRRVEEQLEAVVGWDFEPRWVGASAHAGGVTNGYEHPNRLGADRWVALVGARQRVLAQAAQAAQAAPASMAAHAAEAAQARTSTRPALVVMVGTAVTVDSLDAGGHFLGGLILPGFGLMQRALEIGTSGLKVPTGEVVDFPTNTSDALMSGGAQAIAGAVERTHRRLLARCGTEPLLLMSGGAAVKLAPLTDLRFETVDTLIFEGLLRLQGQRLAL